MGAIKWTRLSYRTFAANAVRHQLHALAYNLGNFMRTLAMPETRTAVAVVGRRNARHLGAAAWLTNGLPSLRHRASGTRRPPFVPLGKIAGLPDRPTNRAFIVT
jgi:hypothetical protein